VTLVLGAVTLKAYMCWKYE